MIEILWFALGVLALALALVFHFLALKYGPLMRRLMEWLEDEP